VPRIVRNLTYCTNVLPNGLCIILKRNKDTRLQPQIWAQDFRDTKEVWHNLITTVSEANMWLGFVHSHVFHRVGKVHLSAPWRHTAGSIAPLIVNLSTWRMWLTSRFGHFSPREIIAGNQCRSGRFGQERETFGPAQLYTDCTVLLRFHEEAHTSHKPLCLPRRQGAQLLRFSTHSKTLLRRSWNSQENRTP
jgi:hypothetical protein